MKTVSKLLQTKGSNVLSIGPDATVYEAIKLMAAKRVGALVVVDKTQKLKGIISERDYLTKVILHARASKATKVSEIMTTKVVCVHPSNTLEECMALMTEKNIRHLPVIDEHDALVGMVSMRDAVREVIAEKEFVISQLESYITGVPQ